MLYYSPSSKHFLRVLHVSSPVERNYRGLEEFTFIKEYCIYLINRPGRLLKFWTLREGGYSRLGAY